VTPQGSAPGGPGGPGSDPQRPQLPSQGEVARIDPASAARRQDGGEAAMDLDDMLRLKNMHLAPYIQMATALIGKRRRSGGNMFRHQLDTMAILMDYGYIDSVLLKASVIHDLLEDVPDFRRDLILETDEESPDVYKLVLEVTRRPIETKEEFLGRIREFGSERSRILKSADRISNMISLGYVTDVEFIRRYTNETEIHVYPIAEMANLRMLDELRELVSTRRDYLARCFEI
jgi:(p)ppGpp synthase/HD superfamily hydrolase